MANFYELNSLNSDETFFLNLELIVKMEEHSNSDFVRLYLASGDIEDVAMKELNSAMAASGSGFYRFEGNPKAKAGFEALDDSDIEDVTDLSDGNMVDEVDLAPANTNNAQAEGSTVVDDEDGKPITAEEVAYVIQKLRENGFNLS